MKRRLAGMVIALMVVLAAGGTLAYRKAYGTWWQTPERLTYCARTYLRGTPALSHAAIVNFKEALPGAAPYPVVTVGKVPPLVGQPLLAAVTPKAIRGSAGLPCAMAVYLKTGRDAYTAYGLSGGP
jgi:hypothetical protein